MAKIHAPNAKYNGTSASIKFENGVGETFDPNLITWFEENGYTIEADTEPPIDPIAPIAPRTRKNQPNNQ